VIALPHSLQPYGMLLKFGARHFQDAARIPCTLPKYTTERLNRW